MSDPTSYRAALRALRPILAAVLCFSALVNVLMLTGSIYMLQIYDRVLSSGSVETLIGLFVIVVVLYVFLGLYDFLRMRLLSRAGLRLDRMLGNQAFRRSLRDGEALAELETVRTGLSSPAALAFFDLPFVPLFLGLLFVLHSWLGWMTLAGAAIAGALALLGRWFEKSAAADISDAAAAARALEIGARRSAETVEALGLAERLAARWHAHRCRQLAAGQRGSDPVQAISAMSRAFRMLLQSTILTLGAYLVLMGDMTAGMIIASSILSGRALAPLDQIVGQSAAISRARAAHRRLLDRDGATAPGVTTDLPVPEGRLDVRAVTRLVPAPAGASTRPDRPRILSDITFSLAPGDVLGVTGNSGGGKSTLARILVGILDADGGDVRLDGATLDQWSPERRSRIIGYLPQRIEMLPGSIRDNIARFDPAARDGDIFAAARRAGVHDLVLGLARGYDTEIDECGLSGGQMQRVALARAIFGGPRLLVLDEPNSNLDASGEAALSRTIMDLSRAGTTIVLIAHRASILRSATALLRLENGRVAEFRQLSDSPVTLRRAALRGIETPANTDRPHEAAPALLPRQPQRGPAQGHAREIVRPDETLRPTRARSSDPAAAPVARRHTERPE